MHTWWTELTSLLQDLENSASSDAVVREKIAKLPPSVSEVARLAEITHSKEGERLLSQACTVHRHTHVDNLITRNTHQTRLIFV